MIITDKQSRNLSIVQRIRWGGLQLYRLSVLILLLDLSTGFIGYLAKYDSDFRYLVKGIKNGQLNIMRTIHGSKPDYCAYPIREVERL